MVMLVVDMTKKAFFDFLLGSGDYVGCFFDTITYHLEQGKRGSRYPILSHLYDGKVVLSQVPALQEEIRDIEERLRSFSLKDVIWDMEDLTKRPPWGNEISDKATDLSNFFTTSRGSQFFDLFERATQMAMNYQSDLDLKSNFRDKFYRCGN